MDYIMQLGNLLCGTNSREAPSLDIKEVLASRLARYYAAVGHTNKNYNGLALEDVQRDTAVAAMQIVEDAQDVYLVNCKASLPSDEGTSEGIGARDLKQLRTLISIVFKWGVVPKLSSVEKSFPHKRGAHTSRSHAIVDLTNVPEDYKFVSSLIARLLRLVYPDGVHQSLSPTIITVALLERHLADLLRPCLSLGWLPKSLETEATPIMHGVRPPIMRLLTNMPTVETITSLGAVLQASPAVPPHVHKACTSLLNRQLLRPEGVRGLFAAVFGDEDQSVIDTPLEKLDHVCRLLQTVPSGTSEEEYYKTIIPRIIAILRPGSALNRGSHVRAAAYSLSRMLSSNSQFRHQELVATTALPLLQAAFLDPPHCNQPTADKASTTEDAMLSPEDSLVTLIKILTNTDPSPNLISMLLSPILPVLYSLAACISSKKTKDPALQESIDGIIATWGRIVDAAEGIEMVWRVVGGEGGEWEVDVAGRIKRNERPESSQLSMFTPASLQEAEVAGELDIDSNVMNLRPDPLGFVRFLKSIDRPDISSEIFVRLLEGYRELKMDSDSDPLRTLLFLQLVMQMQRHLSGGSSKSNILSQPDHILLFVKHALSPADVQFIASGTHTRAGTGLTVADLRIISDDEENLTDPGDSDDEEDAPDDELTSTSVDLLLAVLESNANLSVQSAPILNEIFVLLEPLITGQSEPVRALAREARMVITARMASSSALPSGRSSGTKQGDEDPQETYQKALNLLQDPILPVRAHGLLLLRQLVTVKQEEAGNSSSRTLAINEALIPAILSIFLQSLQDEDSYIYLNAVQGLSAMVDTRGKDVLRGLVNAYCGDLQGLAGTELNIAQLDVRLRAGEALAQIIRRCGTALAIHVDILVPALFRVVREPHLPAALRSSALSLLAQCTSTYALALLPYSTDLVEAMIDLLQTDGSAHPAGAEVSMDEQPTSSNAKVAPLRRSALHLVSLLVRSFIQVTYDAGAGAPSLPRALLKRLTLTLRYVATTDTDGIAKMMAREATELVEALEKAELGL